MDENQEVEIHVLLPAILRSIQTALMWGKNNLLPICQGLPMLDLLYL